MRKILLDVADFIGPSTSAEQLRLLADDPNRVSHLTLARRWADHCFSNLKEHAMAKTKKTEDRTATELEALYGALTDAVRAPYTFTDEEDKKLKAAAKEKKVLFEVNVLADWFADHNREAEAGALAYCVKNGLYPYVSIPRPEEKDKEKKEEDLAAASWFNKDKVAQGLGEEYSNLPEQLYEALEGGKPVANHKTWPTVQAAIEALAAAWAKLDPVYTKSLVS
jgi:hypothetical protein